MNAEQRQIELFEIESSMRQHHETLLQQEKISSAYDLSVYTKFSLLKPKLFKDGNQWCCLYGEDLQVGIAGFGNSPHEAIMSWNKEWHKN